MSTAAKKKTTATSKSKPVSKKSEDAAEPAIISPAAADLTPDPETKVVEKVMSSFNLQ